MAIALPSAIRDPPWSHPMQGANPCRPEEITLPSAIPQAPADQGCEADSCLGYPGARLTQWAASFAEFLAAVEETEGGLRPRTFGV